MILSDSEVSLRAITAALPGKKDTYSVAKNFVVGEIAATSERLRTCRGLDVALELFWVKGHALKILYHTDADTRAKSRPPPSSAGMPWNLSGPFARGRPLRSPCRLAFTYIHFRSMRR